MTRIEPENQNSYLRNPRNPRLIQLAKEIFGTIEKPFVQGGVVFADEGGELLQFAALLRIQSRRHFHNHPRQQVTASASFNVHNAFAAQFKNLSALSASWNLHIRLTFERRDRNLAAKRS